MKVDIDEINKLKRTLHHLRTYKRVDVLAKTVPKIFYLENIDLWLECKKSYEKMYEAQEKMFYEGYKYGRLCIGTEGFWAPGMLDSMHSFFVFKEYHITSFDDLVKVSDEMNGNPKAYKSHKESDIIPFVVSKYQWSDKFNFWHERSQFLPALTDIFYLGYKYGLYEGFWQTCMELDECRKCIYQGGIYKSKESQFPHLDPNNEIYRWEKEEKECKNRHYILG